MCRICRWAISITSMLATCNKKDRRSIDAALLECTLPVGPARVSWGAAGKSTTTPSQLQLSFAAPALFTALQLLLRSSSSERFMAAAYTWALTARRLGHTSLRTRLSPGGRASLPTALRHEVFTVPRLCLPSDHLLLYHSLCQRTGPPIVSRPKPQGVHFAAL